MALSKWFLCGSEGAFDKDESLAYTFAEKAARKGLPSAEFAMGYYMEVGVGGPKDIEAARKWYTRVSKTFCHLSLPDVWPFCPVYRHPNMGTRTLLSGSPPCPSPHLQPSPARNTTTSQKLRLCVSARKLSNVPMLVDL
jgi:hypothetical protein